MIARNGRPVFAYAGGYADRSRHVRNTLHTGFDLASMGKMFTIVAIAQLADAGKIDFKAPLSAYLPDYPNKSLADRVTIEELLTHTGGTGDIFTEDFERRRASLRTLDDYIALFGARDPAFEPGSRRAYSNYGFILLGKVVERVSGESYGDYLVRHIYRPAGMRDAGLLPKGHPPRVAIGYTLVHGKLTSRAFTLAEPGTSAGGGYASVFDMVKFAQALRDGRLMSPDRFTTLAQGSALIGGKSYRYDFGDKTGTGVAFIGHSGGNLGVSGDFHLFPQSGYTLVVLTNFGPPWQKIGPFVSNRLPVGPPAP
jgi:CubicO group peptidase (beta-lactamase class C family)